MFHTVLIANRGEISCRIAATLSRMGIRSVAIFTPADAAARHVSTADAALPVSSYLSVDEVVAAARLAGAGAVHPGYGFLSENAELARACTAAGITFIGPGERALEIMGDKIAARHHVVERGIPVVPGGGEAGMTDEQLAEVAVTIGFPVLIKPSAGGGGKGMTVVASESELLEGIAAARRVALGSFGSDSLLIERFVASPRHIEVQVLADRHGNVIHLGERECSLQRRHQKIVEEAPSPLLTPQQRERMGEAACEVARSVSYEGVGTIEFLVSNDDPDEFFFMEMNTRLQVEHPVTELITGIDLVEWQVRVANGEPLDLEPVAMNGHAIEVRLYAEDPANGFLPSAGTVVRYREPTGVRVDSAVMEGLEVSSSYDPMLAKIIAHGATRAEALSRLRAALDDTLAFGVRSNLEFLRLLLRDESVAAGELDTGLIERFLASEPLAEPRADDLAIIAFFASTAVELPAPWNQAPGWRVAAPAPQTVHLALTATASTPAIVSGSTVSIAAESFDLALRPVGDRFAATVNGEVSTIDVFRAGDTVWLARNGRVLDVRIVGREERLAAHRASLSRVAGSASPEVRAPMPGTVSAVAAASGDFVNEGDLVLTIEAMKMEHKMLASQSGVVTVDVSVGDLVSLEQVVARITPHEGSQGAPS